MVSLFFHEYHYQFLTWKTKKAKTVFFFANFVTQSAHCKNLKLIQTQNLQGFRGNYFAPPKMEKK